MIQDHTASDITNTTDGCCMIRGSAYRNIIKKLFSPEDCLGTLSYPTTTSSKLADAEITLADDLDTLVQIRYGGVKGILVPYPDEIFNRICMAEDKRSKPNQYVFAYRPSMLKYKNGPTWLEINGYAKNPTRARLNCAFIILLLTLGTQITVR